MNFSKEEGIQPNLKTGPAPISIEGQRFRLAVVGQAKYLS